MKIYTRTGDDGTTGLIGGQRVLKSDPRIECTGVVDELNAALGVASVNANDVAKASIKLVQDDLFVIGAHLATPPENAHRATLPILDSSIAHRLEREIDETEVQLTPLKNFILPGGCEASARLHFARTICRRVERTLVHFAPELKVPEDIVIYINRLSDWLFVQARLANAVAGHVDVIWEPHS